ncbi:hypothetical protein [Iodobacter sp.]|uniref:hypothetical protein n=1 Tax=Iodobacter sp. TaxID=1915058 RepID=UPI0025F2BF3A|nr:hypothetical protein [Iodobacter sp.]
MFISFEKKTYGVCLAGLLTLGFSQLSFAADAAAPPARQTLDQQANTGENAQTHDVLGTELAAYPELELVTPLALGLQRGSDRQGGVVIDRRMFKHLRVEKNADILPGKKERELQESEALRSKLAKSAFAEALEKAKHEEEARADRAARERGYLEAQQMQRYECIPVPSNKGAFPSHCAPQVSGVPLTQHRLFPQ